MRVYVAGVQPVEFGHRVAEDDTVAWLQWAAGLGADQARRDRVARLLRHTQHATGIERRRTCVEDHTHTDRARMVLYRPDGAITGGSRPPSASLEDRMSTFADVTTDVARRALSVIHDAPDVLLQVSCTGYVSPSAVQIVAAERGWGASSRFLSLGHMGCHAALPALTTAADAVAGAAARDDAPATAATLHVELCTLHLRIEPDSLAWVPQAGLFGDGAARVDVTTTEPAVGFEIIDAIELLIPASTHALTWELADAGFVMYLDKQLPALIRAHVGPAVSQFLKRHDLTIDDVDNFALHPGGPRILDVVADSLVLDPDRYRHSSKVFRENGNMSSATVPYIWSSILDDPSVRDGSFVCSLAFGPGLTLVANLMRVIR